MSSRLRWRRRLRSLAALALLAAMALAVWLSLPAPVTTLPLVEVIDGDSLRLRHEGKPMTLRLAGFDAVEYRQDCLDNSGRNWPCGREARAALARLAGGGPLYCAIQARDRYGRTLATCRTRPSPEGHDLGVEMVRQGWAVTMGDTYLLEEAEAQAKRRGIWQGVFTPPADWRAEHAAGGADGKTDD